jgi:signal transduction histidine kinase
MNSTIQLYIRSWHFWLVVALLILGVILHYPQELPIIGGDMPKSLLGLERHSGERIIFFVAIMYGGLMLGLRAGVVIAVVSLAAMVPRFWISAAPADAVVETLFTVVVGVLVIVSFNAYQTQKRRLERAVAELQAARDQLHAGLQATKQGESEKEQGRRRTAPELTGDTAQGLAALSREFKGLAASTGSRFEGLSQRIDKVQERLDEILAGMSRSE